MNKLTDWIKRHQIIAFFIITFAITWGLGFSYSAVNKGNYLLLPLVVIASCGPALAGIIISALCNNQPRQGTRKASWIAFFVAWAVSTFVFLANIKINSRVPSSPAAIGLISVSVVPVAFVISMTYSRLPAVKSYLFSLIRLRGVWGWCILALVLFPALLLLTIPIGSLLGRQPLASHPFQDTGMVLIGLIAVRFSYQLFFFNATGEEVGWRGFALPRMQARTSPLVASLVVGFIWCSWHFYYWQAEGSPVSSWQWWLGQYALHITTSVIIGWLYIRSRGSILVAGIAHAAANTAFAFFPNPDVMVFALTAAVAILVMVVIDRMWKNLPPGHPAVFWEPVLDV